MSVWLVNCSVIPGTMCIQVQFAIVEYTSIMSNEKNSLLRKDEETKEYGPSSRRWMRCLLSFKQRPKVSLCCLNCSLNIIPMYLPNMKTIPLRSLSPLLIEWKMMLKIYGCFPFKKLRSIVLERWSAWMFSLLGGWLQAIECWRMWLADGSGWDELVVHLLCCCVTVLCVDHYQNVSCAICVEGSVVRMIDELLWALPMSSVVMILSHMPNVWGEGFI